jgi:hypothetical protein
VTNWNRAAHVATERHGVRWITNYWKRERDPERRTAMIPIFCPYQPVVRLNIGARDGWPHAHALGVASKERFKDLF